MFYAHHDRDAKRRDAAIVAMDALLDGEFVLHVGRDDFESTVDVWEQYRDHDPSVTDANSIALCERYDIDAVLSFDSDFDGLVDRRDSAQV
ncbi:MULTISPECIES: hypothetical protein [Halorussus]|uniref:hypothetical protein n=1 Tax=Halorussus TaxID=1070314 RepID=UPI0018779438|nr:MULTISPECIES: hypothetical protein [Halorussus]